MTPQLWVISGPNGAGKSTLAARFLKGRLPIVNPDVIARELPLRDDGSLNQLDAGRIALNQRSEYLRTRVSFGFEMTLSGRSELRDMAVARTAGFKVNLVYVGIASASYARGRVAERVRGGGHDVPSDALARRYDRGLAALGEAASLADRTILFDNSGDRLRLVLVAENGDLRLAGDAPLWLRGSSFGRSRLG